MSPARRCRAQRQALNVTQSIYDGGAAKAATRLAENGVRAERARLMLLEQDVLLEAITAYTAVARDRQVLELASANEERLRVQLDATRDRERFGDVTKTDIFQAESRHAGAIAARIAAEGAVKVSAADYRRLTGEWPDQLELPPAPDEATASLDEALAQSRCQLGMAGRLVRAGGGARRGQRHAGWPEAEPQPGRPGRLRHGRWRL